MSEPVHISVAVKEAFRDIMRRADDPNHQVFLDSCPKPLPTGHVVLTGELPEADGAFFESESKKLAKENA